MTKSGHIIVGACLAVSLIAVGQPLTVALGVMLGATAPDYLEYSYWDSTSQKYQRVIPHRTLTHYVWIWIALLAIALLDPFYIKSMITDIGYHVFLGFIYGGLSHLIADIGTPSGIPLITPFGKRTSLYLYKTGKEWAPLLACITLTGAFVLPIISKGNYGY